MKLLEVSQTAIYTLLCRATQMEKGNPALNDSMAVLCLDNLLSLASVEEQKRILKLKKTVAGIGVNDAKLAVQRTNKIDSIAKPYIMQCD